MLGHALAVAWILLQTPRAATVSPAPTPPVAIVAALKGDAWSQSTAGSRHSLSLYDWLPPDAIVELAAPSTIELILIDGKRYSVNGGARVKVSSSSLSTIRGSVNEMAPVPTLTSLAPIAGNAPRSAGAVRLRVVGIANLNPCQTMVALADETILRFEPAAGAVQYEIQVRASDDREVLTRTIDKPPLAIPPGVLKGGATYIWTVRAIGTVSSVKSEGRFSTLDEPAAAARRTLATALESTAPGVVGGIDFHLGLLNEAAAELTVASQRVPTDVAMEAAAKRARGALTVACR